MKKTKLLKKASDSYINYRHKCEAVAKEAQKYIDWDERVSCEYLPADDEKKDDPENLCSIDIENSLNIYNTLILTQL